MDDLQGEEEPLEHGAQSVQTGIRRQLPRRQIRVVGHVIEVRHTYPRTKPDIGLPIDGKQSMQVAMPDLGAVLELRELIGGPRGQFVTSAGETDGLSAFRHRAHRLVEAVKIGQLHMVEHHQQIDVAVRPGLATQIAALQSHAQQTFAECLPQCRHRQSSKTPSLANP